MSFILPNNIFYLLKPFKKLSWMWRMMVLAMVMVLPGQSLRAQDAFIFDHLTTKDGLASNFVNCVWQDHKGFIWIGTENGLQRYDGKNFAFVYGYGWDALGRTGINQIVEDKDGRIWIRSENKIGIYDPATGNLKIVPVHTVHPGESAASMTLNKDADGNVFVLAYMINWYSFNKNTFSFEPRKTPFSIPYEWKVSNIHQDVKTRNFWITSFEKGIVLYDVHQNKFYSNGNNTINHPLLKESKLSRYVSDLYIDRKRRYWITAWDLWPGGKKTQDFYCYDEKIKDFTKDTSGIKREALKSGKYFQVSHFTDFGDSGVVVYGDNIALINRGRGFESFNRQDLDNYVFEYGIQSNIVNQIFQDKEQTLWVATDDGLYGMPVMPRQNMHVTFRNANVNTILEGPDASVWVGTWGKGILAFDSWLNQDKKTDIYDHAPQEKQYKMVWSMHQQSNAPWIWIGCQEGRLIIYDTLKHHSSFLNPSVFNSHSIRSIAEDKQHNLWFSTQRGEIIRWNGSFSGKDSGFTKIQEVHNMINRTMVDSHGWLWACTDASGLYVVDTRSGKIINTYSEDNVPAHRISRDKVDDVVQYDDSTYFLAAGLLNKINIKAGTVTTAFGNDNSQFLGGVKSIVLDNNKQLWLSTINDIFRFNPSTQSFVHYNQHDGLISTKNQKSILDVSYKCRNGHIIFGGNDNLLYFNPAEYRNKKIPSNVVITDFRVGLDFLPTDSLMALKRINLKHDQNSIRINFSSLMFSEVNKLSYEYMLKGIDQGWQRTQDASIAVYNVLPPGDYTFMVRAINEEGIYSKNTTELHIIIHPPFWQTPWFIALEILVCAIIIYYLYRMRVNRLLHVERVRARLARDLHDDMGSTLSTINILSNMAIKKLEKDNTATKEYITRISDNSSRIMEAMDDIVWSINPVNDTMTKVIARMKEFAGNVLESKDIDYSFLIDDDIKDITFDMESKRELYLIFKESINNLAKYSRASKAVITMYMKKKNFVMKIDDDGIGFNPEDPVLQSTQRGNGVRNIKKRAEHINGVLYIRSKPGEGTQVELLVPIA